MCTATKAQLKDKHLIQHGFPINRSIQLAREIFLEVDEDEFLARPSSARFNITHKPISAIDILPDSPLHGYIRIFSWLMNLAYHIHAGVRKWSPTLAKVESSISFVRNYLHEKTGIKIDQMIADIPLRPFHTTLAVILRIYNSDKIINGESFEIICKDIYQLILDHYPWANVTPTLHKILAHSVELMVRYNEGRGMKAFSEEGLESCNKHIRRYREILARKTNFEEIFVMCLYASSIRVIMFHSYRGKNIQQKHKDETGDPKIDELLLSLVRE